MDGTATATPAARPTVSRAKAYLKVRHVAVRKAMKELKLDGLLLTHPKDLAYLTNFTGDDSVGLVTDKDVFLATDFRFKEQAELEAGWLKVRLRDPKMSDCLAATMAEAKCKRVGFEANFTTVGQIDAMQTSMRADKRSANIELVPLDNVMLNLRKVKDDHEVDLIRKSVAIAEEAFDVLRDAIKVGEKESYLAGLLVFELRSRGASGDSFQTIVASGANSSLPHYRPQDVPVQRDQPLLIDWGAVHKGYCSDLTRTLLIGRCAPRIKKVYEVVYTAQLAAIKFLRPGVTTNQADRVAREIIEQAGFGEQFGHGLGHGIGRDIHELPSMRKTGGDEELRPGMIVTVEPGIYLPGEGGVRIEDDVLITHSGCEVLSTLDKTIEGCHLE